MVDEDDKERIRLAEADLAQTNEFIKGVLTVSAALRGSAITLWLTLLGFTLSQRLPELTFLALAVAVLFFLVDGYHGWLYGEALKHARSVEVLLSQYYDALSRYRDDPKALIKFRGRLRAQRFGLYLSFRSRFRLRSLFSARPTLIYRVLYPALAGLAVCVWLVFAFGLLDAREAQNRNTAPPTTSACTTTWTPVAEGLTRRTLVQFLKRLHPKVKTVQLEPSTEDADRFDVRLLTAQGRSVMQLDARRASAGWSVGHEQVCPRP